MFSKGTAFQLAAEVEAACVLCSLNFLVSMPACCITVCKKLVQEVAGSDPSCGRVLLSFNNK